GCEPRAEEEAHPPQPPPKPRREAMPARLDVLGLTAGGTYPAASFVAIPARAVLRALAFPMRPMTRDALSVGLPSEHRPRGETALGAEMHGYLVPREPRDRRSACNCRPRCRLVSVGVEVMAEPPQDADTTQGDWEDEGG